jgi:hypothetical protein
MDADIPINRCSCHRNKEMLALSLESLVTMGLNKDHFKYQRRHTAAVNRHSLQGMNQNLVAVAVAMMVPAVAVIYVVILERKYVPEEPITAEIVLMIPALSKLPPPVVKRRRRLWSRLKNRTT